jgi:hypothetical protein
VKFVRPQKGPLAALTEEEFKTFGEAVGWLFVNSVKAAAFARHRWPLKTLQDYLDVYPDDTAPQRLAKEFAKDLATQKMPTDVLALKWFQQTEVESQAEVSEMLARRRMGLPQDKDKPAAAAPPAAEPGKEGPSQ